MLKRSQLSKTTSKLKNNTQLKRSPMTVKGSVRLKSGSKLKKGSKTPEEIQVARIALEMQWLMFKKIWIQRGPYSEVSGIKLYGEPSSMMFHHIMPKSKYKQLKYIEENIIIIHPDEHSNVESNMYLYPEVNRRREQLKIKYNL